MRKSVAESLKEKSIPEPNSGCWLWEATTRRGYGRVRVNGKMTTATRASYATFICDPGDLHVLHKCDNPLCINPEHLFLGNHNDNMRDMSTKCRAARGPDNKMFRAKEKHPQFGKRGKDSHVFGKKKSINVKLAVHISNIMRSAHYWGA